MTNFQKSALYARKDLICFLLNSLQKNISLHKKEDYYVQND